MNLYDEFLLREKLAKSLANAEACQVRADAGLAKIAAYEAEAAELLKEAEGHLAAIQSLTAPNGGVDDESKDNAQ